MSLNDDFTQYGTNHWKNKPKGCGKRVRKKSTKWYGTTKRRKKAKKIQPGQFYVGSTTVKFLERMHNNLKEKSKTLIGITLKTINHNAIKVFFPNFCQNYEELKNLASNHTLPMIAINHKIHDELGKYKKELMKELAKPFLVAS